MKTIRKIVIFLLILFIALSFVSEVKAEELKTVLNVLNENGETKYLENDQGYISKSIVNSNSDIGEVTIQLKVSNTKKETSKSNDTEIILVIDNSNSMGYKTVDGDTRKSIILNSARNLVNTVFDNSSNVKMGIVKFYSSSSVVTKLTSQKAEVLEGITTIDKNGLNGGTNIQNALIKAKGLFSTNAGNKVIILLTDGCPTEDAKGNHVLNSQMVMTSEKYKTILSNTKNELINAKSNGINLISLMTGVNSNDVDEDGTPITTTEDDLQATETIFGTKDNPTAGKFYNVKTTDINQVIQNDISKDVQEIINTPINNVKVTDYFPADITENFTFEYDGNPSIGTTSDKIDEKANTIEWNIGTLKGNEVAILKYKLKIKDMQNKNIMDKEIATNEKVELTYKDVNSKDYNVVLQNSPKIKLVKKELTANSENSVENKMNIDKNNPSEQDNTIAKGVLPKTGVNYLIITLLVFGLIGLIYAFVKKEKYKDVK